MGGSGCHNEVVNDADVVIVAADITAAVKTECSTD